MSDAAKPNLRCRLAARRARKRQHTFVYCPSCKYEMVSGGDWMGQNIDDPSIEAYKCARCGTFSAWNFDTPAPILVRSGGAEVV